MAPKINPLARTIEFKTPTKREFFLIHGYTGSPTDFGRFGRYLHRRFNANVKIIRLKGHGEKIESLDNLTYLEFLKQVEKEFKKDLKKGMKVVVGGHCFGAFFAFHLASKYDVEAVISVSMPLKLRFPFNLWGLKLLTAFKKYWKKTVERPMTKLKWKFFSYEYMHKNSLKILDYSRSQLYSALPKVTAPCLVVYSKKDFFGHFKSIDVIDRLVKSELKEFLIFEKEDHNPFYSPHSSKIYKKMGNFFEKYGIFDN